MKVYAVSDDWQAQSYLRPLRQVKCYAAPGANDYGNGMKGFGSITNLTEGDRAAFVGYPHVLVSFMYDQGRRFFSEKLGYWPKSIIGDSGAFTVWTKGETVDLAEYTDWALHYQTLVPGFVPITLDVIPGTVSGAAPSTRERSKAIRQGMENSDHLRAQGLKIMEVFHWHEPIKHLDLLLDRKQPGELLGIGGLAGTGSSSGKLAFCDSVFARLRDRYGWRNLPPVHGLGIAPGNRLAHRFPWWSIDSSSWSAPGRFGYSVTTGGKRGKADKRISDVKLREVYIRRILDGWQTQERALTDLWQSRGVRFNWGDDE